MIVAALAIKEEGDGVVGKKFNLLRTYLELKGVNSDGFCLLRE